MQYIPTEFEEALILVEYLRLKNIKFCHINNEVYTKSRWQKSKMMAQGTAKGFPDYLIIINNRLIAIELKRSVKSKSKVTKEQEIWVEELNRSNVPSKVCYGAKGAIDFISQYT